jgi:hypothetical protein
MGSIPGDVELKEVYRSHFDTCKAVLQYRFLFNDDKVDTWTILDKAP